MTPEQMRAFADALDCFWNASIGSARQSQDATAMVSYRAVSSAGDHGAVMVWTGSCPCQPFSAAGKGDDRRGVVPKQGRCPPLAADLAAEATSGVSMTTAPIDITTWRKDTR